MSTEDRLILLSIAAEELGYTSERLRQFIKDGRVEGVRRGRLWFLRESEIETLRQQTKGGYKSERRTGPPERNRGITYEPVGEHVAHRRVAERRRY